MDNFINSLSNQVVSIILVILAILIVIILIASALRRKINTLDNPEDDMLNRTGGAAGGFNVNMVEMGQPGVGPQTRRSSYYNQFYTSDFAQPPKAVREGLTATECGSRRPANDKISKYLNMVAAGGKSGSLNISDTYIENGAGPDSYSADYNMLQDRYNQCLATGSPQQCSISLPSFVNAQLQTEAYGL